MSAMKAGSERSQHHEYFMSIAIAVRERAQCLGRSVGAVLVRDGRIIATGYNGTPENMPNCDASERGCLRCSKPREFEAGTGYDLCICVHAEQNALLSAARFGTAVENAVLYSTLRPCFGCTKEALQAKIRQIYYLADWEHPDRGVAHQYDVLQARLPGGVRPLQGMTDPNESGASPPLAGTGHDVPSHVDGLTT